MHKERKNKETKPQKCYDLVERIKLFAMCVF